MLPIRSTCPLCRFEGTYLDVIRRVDYFRCDDCAHVWAIARDVPREKNHITVTFTDDVTFTAQQTRARLPEPEQSTR